MSKFQELLEQLNAEQEAQDTLAKALPQDSQDDANIQAAAADGDDDAKGEEDDDGEEKTITKSLTLNDGEVFIDATDLLKALQDDVTEHSEVLAKAMPQILQLVQGQSKMIQQQGELIKSMQTRIDTLAGQGRGRKTVVTLSEKQGVSEQQLAKSEQDGISPQEFMLKANNAFEKGVINGVQLNTIDVSLRQGVPLPSDIIAKIANS